MHNVTYRHLHSTTLTSASDQYIATAPPQPQPPFCITWSPGTREQEKDPQHIPILRRSQFLQQQNEIGKQNQGPRLFWAALGQTLHCKHTAGALQAHCGHTVGALRAHVSKTTQRRWREETSSNTCRCSNTTEQSDSLMSEIPIENAYRHTIGVVGNKVREME